MIKSDHDGNGARGLFDKYSVPVDEHAETNGFLHKVHKHERKVLDVDGMKQIFVALDDGHTADSIEKISHEMEASLMLVSGETKGGITWTEFQAWLEE